MIGVEIPITKSGFWFLFLVDHGPLKREKQKSSFWLTFVFLVPLNKQKTKMIFISSFQLKTRD